MRYPITPVQFVCMARFRNTETRYGWLGQAFHWLIASLIVTQYVLGQVAEQAGEAGRLVDQLALLARHKSVGITVLALTAMRLTWRFISPPPPLPTVTPRWQTAVARLTHGLIYTLLITLPVSGWLMSSASSYSVSVFGILELPDLVSPNESFKEQMQAVHHTLGTALFSLLALHLAAALKHHLFDKDDILRRMMPPTSWLLLIACTATSLGLALKVTPAAQPGPVTGSGQADVSAPLESELSVWDVDYSKSTISFTGDQAGAGFTGYWRTFHAQVQFDARDLEGSAASVVIDADSVDTRDAERDEIIRGPDFFDVLGFPTVTFSAGEFSKTRDGGYLARGSLTIRGEKSPVELVFSVDTMNGRTVLDGHARLDRIRLGVGRGDWLDTSWVGQYVKVDVHLEAR